MIRCEWGFDVKNASSLKHLGYSAMETKDPIQDSNAEQINDSATQEVSSDAQQGSQHQDDIYPARSRHVALDVVSLVRGGLAWHSLSAVWHRLELTSGQCCRRGSSTRYSCLEGRQVLA